MPAFGCTTRAEGSTLGKNVITEAAMGCTNSSSPPGAFRLLIAWIDIVDAGPCRQGVDMRSVIVAVAIYRCPSVQLHPQLEIRLRGDTQCRDINGMTDVAL